jgi:DNA mismatch repair protein MutS
MLLYGVNAVGKSSLMKSVGLAVLMAQAGMYVAADSIELCPYHEIYTRVGLRDDLTRGHSTFVVEMLELRAILRQSGNRSLIIGDELCAGTESQSALAIVGSAISQLAKKGSSFVFATHLHELVDLPVVKDLIADNKVLASHLSVRFVDEKLVMDRRLSPGTGPPTYGLEVCRSLDMDPEFLERAEEIRRHVMGTGPLVTPRRSRYNAKLVVDTCGVCGEPATETHHLEPQATAKKHVKNRRHNLVPLCEKCHDDAHAGKIKIEGYKTTSDGVELGVS